MWTVMTPCKICHRAPYQLGRVILLSGSFHRRLAHSRVMSGLFLCWNLYSKHASRLASSIFYHHWYSTYTCFECMSIFEQTAQRSANIVAVMDGISYFAKCYANTAAYLGVSYNILTVPIHSYINMSYGPSPECVISNMP